MNSGIESDANMEFEMSGTDLALALMSLLAAYGGSYVGEYLLNRCGL